MKSSMQLLFFVRFSGRVVRYLSRKVSPTTGT